MLHRLAPLLFLAGCAASPSPEAFATADRGPKPDDETAQAAARWVLDHVLEDHWHATVEFVPPIREGYHRDGGDFAFAWVLEARVNDPGAVVTAKRTGTFEFFFRDDRIVAFSNTFDVATAMNRLQRVIGEPSLESFRRGETPTWVRLKDVHGE